MQSQHIAIQGATATHCNDRVDILLCILLQRSCHGEATATSLLSACMVFWPPISVCAITGYCIESCFVVIDFLVVFLQELWRRCDQEAADRK